MKTQIKFQKILFLVTLIIAALTLVYGFSYCTGSLAYAFKARSGLYSAPFDKDPIYADALYSFVIGEKYVFNGSGYVWESTGSGFNDTLVVMAIVLIVLVALQFFFATNSRRNYYITNYISVAVLAVYAIVFAAVAFWGIAHSESLFNALNWKYYKDIYDVMKTDGGSAWSYYSDSHIMFALGYVLFAIVIVDAVLLILNTVWKVLLMRGERALLAKNSNTTETEVLQ